MRRLFLSIIFTVGGLCASCVSTQQATGPVRLLFVGNSLTYVGNLPAVLDALATSNGNALQSDMIVKGGATLAERVADGSVERALAAQHYDYVVLQERGGDAICAFGPASCTDAEASVATLARIVAAHDAKTILLGTYQLVPQVSAELVAAESAAASRNSIAYVSVSDRLQTAIESAPSAEWLHADRAHPGRDLVLLEAVLLYRQVFGALPAPGRVTVQAPIYEPNTLFSAPAPTSHSISVQHGMPLQAYPADRVAAVIAVASGGIR